MKALPTALLLGCVLLECGPVYSSLNPAEWRVVDVSTQNISTGEEASHAIDGNPETQWHTHWHDTRKTEPAQPPHFLTVDLGKSHPVSAIRYRARAHGEGGLPKDYSLELSPDGHGWTLASKGAFAFRSTMSPHGVIALNKPVKARFLRLTITSLQETGRSTEPGLVVGEIDVATPNSPLVATTLLPVPQSRPWNYGGYDWFNRHRAVLAYSAEHKPRLVFLGDSINHQWGGPPTDVTARSGEAIWNRYYSHRNAVSLGYGWDRLENMLWRLRSGELAETDPKLVVLMAGTNNLEVNSPEEIAAGVKGLCDGIHRQKPKSKILLLAIFPRGTNRHYPELEEANRRIRQLSNRSYILFQDIGPAFLNETGELTRDVMPDLLHPNEEGYRRWAQAIEPIVSRILGDPPVGQ